MERRKCIAYWPLLLLLALSSLAVGAEDKAAADKDGDIFAKRAERSRSNFAKQDERMAKAREHAAKKEYVAALKIMEDVLAELDLEKSDIDSECSITKDIDNGFAISYEFYTCFNRSKCKNIRCKYKHQQ